jgi:hypothetical protein
LSWTFLKVDCIIYIFTDYYSSYNHLHVLRASYYITLHILTHQIT